MATGSIIEVKGELVDLRSDTVTVPTDEMRHAMATAVVGDDGFGEDPTVNALEERFAERVGKEAAIYVPSGVMANQIALRVLSSPGDLIVAGARQHVVLYELGAAGRNASVQFAALDDTTGAPSPVAVAEAVAAAAHHQPSVASIFLESPHMASGGQILGPTQLGELAEAAGGLPIHLDGARLFNAEVASGFDVAELAAEATTVMSCLSKGLSAPVGSLLAGPAPLIDLARIERKRLGGAMRQAGILAAAGLLALEHMVGRLADDHLRARQLADAVLRRWPEARAVAEQPTNLVVFEHADTAALLDHLSGEGVLADSIAPGVMRFVTHRGVDDAGVERATAAILAAP